MKTKEDSYRLLSTHRGDGNVCQCVAGECGSDSLRDVIGEAGEMLQMWFSARTADLSLED